MDTLSQAVIQPLELLIYVSLVLILIIGIFLIKLLLDMSNLVNSLQDFIKVTRTELEPAIREINGTLANINKLSTRLNSQIDNINNGLERGGRVISDASMSACQKLKNAGIQAKDMFLSLVSAFVK